MKKIISCLLVVAILCSCFAGLNIVSSATDLPTSGQIGENVFYTFDSSTGELVISGSGDMYLTSPFCGETSINSVIINGFVTSICKEAFYNCSNLTSVTITSTVDNIGVDAFESTASNFVVYCYQGSYAVNYCETNNISFELLVNSISGSCGENVYYTLDSSTGILTISGVGKIDNFYHSNGLDNNHLVQYSNSPFNNNKEIKDVIITGGVQNIGAALFWNCSNIQSISINTTSIQSIDAFAFSGCSNLTRVDFTDTLKRIDCYAFEKCEKLTNIVIPNSVEELGSYCFDNCSKLKTIN